MQIKQAQCFLFYSAHSSSLILSSILFSFSKNKSRTLVLNRLLQTKTFRSLHLSKQKNIILQRKSLAPSGGCLYLDFFRGTARYPALSQRLIRNVAHRVHAPQIMVLLDLSADVARMRAKILGRAWLSHLDFTELQTISVYSLCPLELSGYGGCILQAK